MLAGHDIRDLSLDSLRQALGIVPQVIIEGLDHRIEINQKSKLSRKLVPLLFNAHVHQYAILTPSWQVPPALLTFKRHLPVTKANVFVLMYEKAGVETAGGTCQDGVLMT